MAAQPIGRYCACLCGESIDHMRSDAKYSPECRARVDLEKKREYDKQRQGRRKKTSPHEASQRQSVNQRQVFVWRSHAADAPNRRQVLCKVCYGMPWARLQNRREDARDGFFGPSVVPAGSVHCRGCNEPYSPEPAPEPCSVLGSSAGTAARAGELHGHTIERGMNFKKSAKR